MSDMIDAMSGVRGSSYGTTFRIDWRWEEVDGDPDYFYVYEKMGSDPNSLRFGPVRPDQIGAVIEDRQKMYRRIFDEYRAESERRSGFDIDRFFILDDD